MADLSAGVLYGSPYRPRLRAGPPQRQGALPHARREQHVTRGNGALLVAWRSVPVRDQGREREGAERSGRPRAGPPGRGGAAGCQGGRPPPGPRPAKEKALTVQPPRERPRLDVEPVTNAFEQLAL